MTEVNFSGRMPKGIKPAMLTDVVRQAFKAARRSPRGSVAVRFASEDEIAKLNKLYRHKNRPTDVLSFSASETKGAGELGDIILAPRYARQEAVRRGVPFVEEIVSLVAHGMLHLLGYDHATEEDEVRMFHLQEKIVAQFFRN